MSGRHIRKLLTDRGLRYVIFCETSGQFVSPVFSAPDDVVKCAVEKWSGQGFDKGVTREDWLQQAANTKKVYDVRQVKIQRFLHHLRKLKNGLCLTDDEACEVFDFYQFLEDCLSERCFEQIGSMAARAIDELKIRRAYVRGWGWWDILENVCRVVFCNAWENANKEKMPKLPTGQATKEQNRLAGCYLGCMVKVAGIVSPGMQTPEQLVERCMPKRNKNF